MKPKSSLRTFLAASGSAMLLASQAEAAVYYWDTNGTTAGLGDTAGTTWGTTNNSMVSWGNSAINGTAGLVGSSTATTTSDAILFGTNSLSLGATASTIGTSGTLNINTIAIGSAQTNNITLSAGGIITLGGTAPTIAVNTTAANLTIAAKLSGSAGLTKSGVGTLILTNNSNDFTGGVTINGGGTLQLGDGTSGAITSQALTFSNGGGVFNMKSLGTGSTQAMGALTFSTTGAGEGTVQSTYGTSGSTALTFSSLTARGAGATGNFIVSGGSNGTTNKIVLTGATTGTLLDKGFFFDGSRYAAYDAGGFVRAYGSGDANYLAAPAGATMGTTTSSSNVDLTTGDITAQTTDSANTINLRGNSIAISSGNTLSTSGLLSSGSGNASISGGTLQSVSSGAEMVVRVNGGSDALNISSIIQNNTTASALTKSGAGTLTLSGTNTYTGTTTINAGTLALGGGSAIADTGAVVLANAPGATLQLNASETIGNLSGGGFSGGNVNLQGNTLTLADNNSTTFGGTFSGTTGAAITKSGTGTLTLSNKNTFAGSINVNAGTLALAYGYDNTSATSPMSSGGTLTFAGGTSLNLTPTANFSGGGMGGNQNVGGQLISNPINISSGTFSIKTTGNDFRYDFSGGVTAGTSGTQTLSILEGNLATGSGDRSSQLFSGALADGNGGTLALNVDFQGASGNAQQVYVALSGQNTFTGNIAVSNTRNLTGTWQSAGGYLALGGEVIQVAFGTRTVYVGSGGLGYVSGSGSGSIYNYNGTISLASGTFLDYVSNASQTLGGIISGAGNLGIEGTGAGTLKLTAANTYSGLTYVSSGTLNIANSLALQNSALVTTGAGTATLDPSVTTLSFGGLSGATGNLASVISSGYSGVTSLTLNPNSGSVIYGANIVNGSSGMTLTKSGGGTQILSGTNTYTGGTSITAGTLQFGKLVSQPATGAVAVGSGATLAINLGGAGEWTTGTSGNGTIGGLLAGSGGQSGGTVSYSGNVTLGFDTTNASTTQDYAGAIADVGTSLGITKLGANTLVLSGTNTYTGPTTLTSGTLSVGASANLGGASSNLVFNGGTLRITGTTLTNFSDIGHAVSFTSGPTVGLDIDSASNTFTADQILNQGTGGLIKTGAGTLVLNKANTYTGTTTVNAGTLLLDLNGGLLNTSSALTLGGGVFSVIGKNTGTSSQSLGSVTLTSGTGSSITLDANGGTATTLTLGNTWARNSGSTLNLALGSNTKLTSSPGTLNGPVVGNGNIAFATVGGTDWAKVSSAAVVAFAAGDYNATFPASGASSTVNYSITGNGSVTASQTANTLKISTSTTGQSLGMTAGQTLTLNAGGLLFVGANDYNITGGTLAGSGGTQKELAVHQFGSGNLTIDSVIANNGSNATALTKAGTGTLTLTGVNTFTGAVTINGGTMQISGSGSLNSGSYTGAIAINAGSVLKYSSSATQTLGGTISGAGGLTKDTSTSTLTVSGSNTYIGATTVNAGILALTHVNALAGSSGVSVASGATLQVGTTGTYGNTANVTLSGDGINGANKEGALHFATGTSTWNAPITLGGVATRISSFNGAANTTLNAAIGGTGPLTISSRGGNAAHTAVWTLNAASNYTGDTTIKNDAGLLDVTVKLGVNNALPTTTSLNLQGVANTALPFVTLDLNGFNQTLAGLTDTGSSNSDTSNFGKRVINNSATLATLTLNIASGTNTYGTTGTRVLAGTIGGTTAGGSAANNLALNKTGNGTLVLSGTNTYTGGTTLSSGQLNLNSSSSIGTGTFTISGGSIDNTSAAAITLSTNNAQNWNGEFTFTGTKDLNMGTGGVTLGASRTVTVSGGTFTVGGTVTDGSNTYSLTKSGSGTLVITGSNNYKGGTKLGGGILSFANGSLGTTGSITFTGNSTLQWNGANTQDISSRLVMSNGVASTFDTQANNVLFASAIGSSSTGSLVKVGTGTLTLTGANTYSGGTTISAGVLAVGLNNGAVGGDNISPDGTSTSLGSGAVNVAAGAALHVNTAGLTIANNINLNGMSYGMNSGGPAATNSGPWNGAIMGNSKNGTGSNIFSGTITLNATSNISTNWNDKTMIITGKVTGAGGLVLDNSAPNSTRRGGLFRLDNSTNDYAGDTTINNGNSTGYQPTLILGASNVIPDGAGKGNLIVLGNLDLNGKSETVNGLSGNATAALISNGVASTISTLTFGNNNATTSYSGVIQNGSGTVSLTKTGSGTQTLSGSSNTYTGGTNIGAGTLSFANGSLGTAGSITFTGNSTLQWNGSNTQDISSRLVMSNGVTSTFDTQANNVTFASAIGNSSTGSLVKKGSGTLTLSAMPTYTGTTTINEGVLATAVNVGANNIGGPLLPGGAITINQGAALYFNPAIQQSSVATPYTAANNITLSGGTGTATVRFGNKNDTKYALSGTVTGAPNVTQTFAIMEAFGGGGGDRQVVVFSNTIANGTNGTLAVSVDFGGATTPSAQNGFVNLSGQNTFTGDLTVTNSGNIAGGTPAGAWLTIGGERTHLGLTPGSGYLGGGNYSGNISISNGTSGKTTLNYASSANQILAGIISGTGSFQKDGSGTLTLSGPNTYSGQTNVNSGTLVLAGNQTGTTQLVVNNSGILQFGDGSSTNGSSVNSGTIFVNNTGTIRINKTDGGTVTNAIASNPSATTTLAGTNAAGTTNTFTATNYNNGGGFAVVSTNAGAVLAFSGNSPGAIDLKGTNLTVSGAGDTLFTSAGSGIYSSSTASKVIKQGTGMLIFQGNQGFTGNMEINEGAVRVDTAQTNSGTYFVGNGGTTGSAASLYLGGGAAGLSGGVTFDRNVTINPGSGSNRTIGGTNTSGTNTFSGNIAMDGSLGENRSVNLTAASGGTVQFSGVISGAGQNVTKNGSGTVMLSNTNTYSGGTTISEGALSLSTNATAAGSGGINLAGGTAVLQIASDITIANQVTVSNATASVVRTVAAGGSYNVGTTGSLKSSLDGIDTTASILAGTNSAATAATLTMNFNDSVTGVTNDVLRRSDVFSLTGTGSNAYVLQIMASGLASDSVLGWKKGNMWEWAINGNTGNNATSVMQNFMGSFTSFQTAFGTNLSNYIGAYGYDSNVGGSGVQGVWAVVNHNSSFAAIPELSNLLVGGLLGAGLLRRRRS